MSLHQNPLENTIFVLFLFHLMLHFSFELIKLRIGPLRPVTGDRLSASPKTDFSLETAQTGRSEFKPGVNPELLHKVRPNKKNCHVQRCVLPSHCGSFYI
jgi:hypothetical protein